jgi:hemoglobin-like flavoprotein
MVFWAQSKGNAMKAEQLQLVLDSLVLVQPSANAIANSFYEHFFAAVPSAPALFTGDMEKQGTMLMTSLGLAVTGLSSPEELLAAVRGLGGRHVSYGVQPAQYQPFIESFLWALGQHLGAAFTPALENAWREALQALADAMLESYAPKDNVHPGDG